MTMLTGGKLVLVNEVMYRVQRRQDVVIAPDLLRELDAVRQVRGGIFWGELPYGGEGWIAVGYDEVKQVFTDPRFSLARHHDGSFPRSSPPSGDRLLKGFATMDPPEHTAHRRILSKHLTYKRAAGMRPAIEAVVNRGLDAIVAHGPAADLHEDFAMAVPMAVACDLLGIPLEERSKFAEPAKKVITGNVASVEESLALDALILRYFGQLVARRREKPGDDLLSGLVQDTDAGNVWSEADLSGIGRLLLVAGHDGPGAILGGIIYWLAHDPATRDALIEDPDRLPSALEEFLRILPAGTGTKSRIALEDIPVGDVIVKKDQAVMPLVHPANYDRLVFPDPERLDLSRDASAHLRFGFGPHACPGQQVARVELLVAVEALLKRMPGLAAQDPDPRWREHILMRGPKSLLVTW